jgi:polyisoprenoid-binding protein YceI
MFGLPRFVAIVLGLGALGLGCKKGPSVEPAPMSSASLEAPKPIAGAVALTVDAASSAVKFSMESPLEKIEGEAPGSASGELSIDPSDLSKASGLVKIDLDKLTLYQSESADGAGTYKARAKNELQNKHARDWLQLVPHDGEVTAEQVAQFRIAEFRLEKLTPSVPSVAALSGAERKVTATVSGTLRLHGRQEAKTAKLELTFHYEGDKLTSVGVTTLEPVVVNLERFEIHPRDGAGKFVKTLTETIATNLKGKVKGEAPVAIELTAKPK